MDFAVRLALLYAGLFTAIGVQTPFLPLWLTAVGLDAPAIGTLLATGTVARLIAVPLGTRAADRFVSPRRAIVIATLAGAGAVTLLGAATHALWIFCFYALATAAWAIALPLAESYAMRGLPARGKAYGQVRLWGSAAFIAATLVAGWLSALIPPAQIIMLIAAGYWLGAAAAWWLEGDEPGRVDAAPPNTAARPGHTAALGLVLAASSLVQASHGLFYGFGALHWSAAGFSGAAIGALWAVGVGVEITLFACAGRLPRALASPVALLALGAASAVLRWSVMAFDPATPFLFMLQALHGLSFGATHLGAVQFVARAAAPRRAASTQGLLAWSNGAAMAAASAVSGYLYESYGASGYGAMALLAVAGGACAVCARRFTRVIAGDEA